MTSTNDDDISENTIPIKKAADISPIISRTLP